MVNFLKLADLKNVEVIGLPLALSISGIFQFFLLLFFLYKKIGDFRLKEIWNSFKKIILASMLMALFAYLTIQTVPSFLNIQTFLGIFLQTILAGTIGIVVYLLIALFLRSPELKIIKSSFLERFRKNH